MSQIEIEIAIEKIEEVIEESSNEDIIESAKAALETLHILADLGFNNVSLEDKNE